MIREGALFGPAAPELQIVENLMRADVERDPPEVATPMSQLLQAGGKRIRPAIVVLSAMCGQYRSEPAVAAAVAVEIVHGATLVHDDVIDRAPTRRGLPTVAASLGDEAAIVIGDFYFAKAYDWAARTGTPEAVAILADAVMRICAGEVRQQAIRYRYATDVDEYIHRIDAKTATLVAACCDIGGLLGGVSDEKRDALRAYGRSLGLAFQIADDVLDYTATERQVGKPIGHDVLEGFATLPLMLSGVTIGEGRRLDEREARDVVDAVRASDAPERALAQAREHADAAREKLRILGDGDAVSSLTSLTDYVVARNL